MDIGNFSAKIPVADFETLVSFFLQHYYNFLYKVRFHDNLKPKNRTPSCTRLRHPFESFLSTGFLEDFFPMTELKHDLTGDLRGGRRILEGFWGTSNCWAICSGLLGTYAWCLSFFSWWPISRKVGFDERWGLQRARCIGGFHRALRNCTSPMRWVLASWHQNRLGVGIKINAWLFPNHARSRNIWMTWLKRRKSPRSFQTRRRGAGLRFCTRGNRNPKGEIPKIGPGTLSWSWWKRTLAACHATPLCWASGVGVVILAEGVANPGDVDGSCYEKILV